MRSARRLRLAALLAASGIGALAAESAKAAQAITQPAAGPVVACSETDVETTCLLPFGAPFAADSAITQLDLGPVAVGALRIARPTGQGTWNLLPITRTAARWSPVHGTNAVHTAVAVRKDDQLVVLDPQVSAGGTTVDLEPSGEGVIVSGRPVPLAVVGNLTFEPDSDGDGFGDLTQDLCPGIVGGTCEPGSVAVTLTAPSYVPSEQVVNTSWTVTNTSSARQRLLVNIFAPGNAARQYPEGAVCAPQWQGGPTALFVPYQRRSPLAAAAPAGVFETTAMTPHLGRPQEWVHCVLAPLSPGASVSGTIAGRWRQAHHVYSRLSVSAIAPFRAAGETATAGAERRIQHGYFAAPKVGTVGRIANDRLSVLVSCPAPPLGTVPPCRLGGRLTDASGKRRLGSARSIDAPVGETRRLTVKLTAAGRRWLAKRPAQRLRFAASSDRPGEPQRIAVRRFTPKYTAKMRRDLARLRARR